MWTIERLSLKYQGIMSQMTKLTRVTKAILRVPNRLFFLAYQFTLTNGAPAGRTGQSDHTGQSFVFSIYPCEDHLQVQCFAWRVYAEHRTSFAPLWNILNIFSIDPTHFTHFPKQFNSRSNVLRIFSRECVGVLVCLFVRLLVADDGVCSSEPGSTLAGWSSEDSNSF